MQGRIRFDFIQIHLSELHLQFGDLERVGAGSFRFQIIQRQLRNLDFDLGTLQRVG